MCVACIHISLHLKLQHDNLISYVIEKIVDILFDQSGCFQPTVGAPSFCLFLSYLYRFEVSFMFSQSLSTFRSQVISSSLIFDILQKLLHSGSPHELKIARLIGEGRFFSSNEH